MGIGAFLDTIYPVQESVLKSEPDIHYKVDDFASGKCNVLYITGLSGSGKTTLAYDLCNQFNAIYLELDRIEHYKDYLFKPTDREDEKLLQKYFRSQGESRDVNTMPDAEYDKFFMDAYDYLYQYTQRHKYQKFIFEGIQIVGRLHDRPELWWNAIIVKGTSVLESYVRRKRRDGKMMLNGIERSPVYMMAWYLNAEKWLKKFREECNRLNNNPG